MSRSTKFRRHPLAVAAATALFALVAPQAVLAGAGWGDTTNPAYANGKLRTFWANSPSGIWAGACFDINGNAVLDPAVAATTVTCNSGGNGNGLGIRKFVDTLPGLTAAGANGLGNYIPVAVADGATYPGSDYYEIAVVEYTQQFHSDLPADTHVRGYVQIDPAATDSAAGLSNGAVAPAGSKAVALLNADGTPVMISRPDAASATGFKTVQAYGVDRPYYLGPAIVASQNRAVRIKFYNGLPVGRADANGRHGDIFLPVDETLPGAGFGPEGKVKYTQNRAEIHLHGGDNPWISDGTPHQWITPAGEADPSNPKSVAAEATAAGVSVASLLRGPSVQNVPDMADPGPGAVTYYFPNGVSSRLMFYHDHSFGLTRLNVYAGEAAAYVVRDDKEVALTSGTGPLAGVPEIPLVIQDKTFVPKNIEQQDARWDTRYWGGYGGFWYGHVYETNQDPNSADATNPVGRWDWGPFFWPVFPSAMDLPTGEHKIYDATLAGAGVMFATAEPRLSWTNAQTQGTLDGPSAFGLSEVSVTPEVFADTPVVNGVAYPTIEVDPKAYRFRILNAANDRMLNLGLYVAADAATVDPNNPYVNALDPAAVPALCDGSQGTGANCSEVRMVPFVSPNSPTVTTFSCPADGLTPASTQYPVRFPCSPDAYGGLDNGTGTGTGWGQADNRPGGVPDPTTAGPAFHLIGSEGGFLARPVTIPSTPLNYEYNKRSVTVLNMFEKGLFLGNAQRADVVVDFSQYAGKTLIVYNDAPAPAPAGDPRLDYYTGNGDQTGAGGAPNTMPGYGPNMRTIMQIKVKAATPAPAFDFAALDNAIAANYAAGEQEAPIVAQTAYQGVFGSAAPYDTDVYGKIFTGSIYLANYQPLSFTTTGPLSYTPAPGTGTLTYPDGSTLANAKCGTAALCQAEIDAIKAKGLLTVAAGTPIKAYVESKTIQELFDPTWGRMNATLGVELPFTSALTQTTIPLGYVDPATETVADGETQFWKITHNGVDSHPVHFHLVNVQVVNRVGWDGTVKAPYADEIGWKETVVMNPLEDVIVAVRARKPVMPFGLMHSFRANDPSQPLGTTSGFTQVDPKTGNPATVVNTLSDFVNEYVWHCHILGHEENDFMRAVVFDPKDQAPDAPTVTSALAGAAAGTANITWTDPTPAAAATTPGNAKNEIGFRVERQAVGSNVWTAAGNVRTYPGAAFTAQVNALANATSFTDVHPSAVSSQPTAASKPVTVAGAGSTLAAPSVAVSWTWPAPAGSVAPSSFDVMRASVDAAGVTGPFAKITASPIVVAAGTTSASYTDLTVQPGARYVYEVVGHASGTGNVNFVYRVVAVTAVGETPSPTFPTPVTMSATVTGDSTSPDSTPFVTGMVPVTGPITGAILGTAVAPQPQLSWTAVPLAASYNVTYNVVTTIGATRVTTPFTGSSATASFNVPPANLPVLAGATYTITNFSVYAVSASGVVAATADTLANMAIAIPAAPAGFAVARSAAAPDTQLVASWTASAPSATNGPANTYTVAYATNGTFTAGLGSVTGIAASPATLTLNPNTHYWLRVTGINATGTSLPSTVVNLWTAPAAPNNAPTFGAATASSLVVRYGAAPAGTRWSVQLSSNGGATWAASAACTNIAAATVTCTATGLAANTAYQARVLINNATSGLTSSAGPASGNAYTLPTSPATPALTRGATGSRTITVAAVTVPTGLSYAVQYATNATFTRNLLTTPVTSGTATVLSGLTAGTTYYVRFVATSNASGLTATGASSNATAR